METKDIRTYTDRNGNVLPFMSYSKAIETVYMCVSHHLYSVGMTKVMHVVQDGFVNHSQHIDRFKPPAGFMKTPVMNKLKIQKLIAEGEQDDVGWMLPDVLILLHYFDSTLEHSLLVDPMKANQARELLLTYIMCDEVDFFGTNSKDSMFVPETDASIEDDSVLSYF